VSTFLGFDSDNHNRVDLPSQFFSDLLPSIEQINELKAALYFFYFYSTRTKKPVYISLSDFLNNQIIMESFSRDLDEAQKLLEDGLEKAVLRGTLVQVDQLGEKVYVLNSPNDLAAGAAHSNVVIPGLSPEHPSLELKPQRPNIFRLYEDNIGPLTPIMADTLREAETDFPFEWIEEAIEIAVHRNARNWRFIQAILRGWKEKGRHETNRRDPQDNRRKYSQGEFSDFIKH
jgi:DNA replication protein